MATVHGKLVQEAWKSEKGESWRKKNLDFAECVVV